MMQQHMSSRSRLETLVPGDMDGDGMMPPPPTDDPADDGMG